MACKVELFLGVLGVSSSWVWHTYQRVSDILKRNGSVIEWFWVGFAVVHSGIDLCGGSWSFEGVWGGGL